MEDANGTEGADSKTEKAVANEENGENGAGGKESETGEAEGVKEGADSAKDGNSATSKDQSNKFLFEYPTPYAHELCTLRQNIVDAFVG